MKKFTEQQMKEFFGLVKDSLDTNKKKEISAGGSCYATIGIHQSFYNKHLLDGNLEQCNKDLVDIVINSFYLYCIHRGYLDGK